MDENKQFDNNGEPIAPPPVPPPAPRYRHEHAEDVHESRCAGKKEGVKEDAFVLRIKRRHIKLAALLLAAFMLGSLWTQMKYYHSSYSGKAYQTSISERIKSRVSGYSSTGNFTIEIPQVTNARTISPASPYFYSTPSSSEPDYDTSCENCYGREMKSSSGNNAAQRSYYFNTK